jgi:hypothetical protein
MMMMVVVVVVVVILITGVISKLRSNNKFLNLDRYVSLF